MNRLQRLGLIYLYSVPPLAAVIGFGVGHVGASAYLPLWTINVCIMVLAMRQLLKGREADSGNYVNAAIFLIIPWMLYSIFAGMGPPPATMASWVAAATEQQARYTLLIIGGISALLGFALLKAKLEDRGERLYQILGFTALSVAIPLFILNMAFWGYYLTDAFRYFVTLPAGKRPEWYSPVKMLFYIISVIEVALTYLATILFALALKKVGILNTRGSYWYIVTASLAILLLMLPSSVPEPFSAAEYLAAIPAIPFIMPYLMGVRLLRLKTNGL